MEKRFIVIICMLFFALGGLFVTRGMTGMYSLTDFKSTCTTDSDCKSDGICCKFYGEDYGICGEFSSCAAVSRATMEEKQQFSVLNPPAPEVQQSKLFSSVQKHVEVPQANYNRNSVIVGLMLIVFAVAVYLFTSRHIRPGYSDMIVPPKRRKKKIVKS